MNTALRLCSVLFAVASAPTYAQGQLLICQNFACAFLAIENAVGEKWSGDVQDFKASPWFSVAAAHLDKGRSRALEVVESSPTAQQLSAEPCLLYTTGIPSSSDFLIGRAYEFEAQRTLSRIRSASVTSEQAYSSLQCEILIGGSQ